MFPPSLSSLALGIISPKTFFPSLLAQDDATSGIDVFFACVLMVGVVVAGAFLVLWLRRRTFGSQASGPVPAGGFTLGDLRQLYKSGQLSEEEFNRAKEKIVLAAQRAAEREAAEKKAALENHRLRGQ
jgi:hypothetical protein